MLNISHCQPVNLASSLQSPFNACSQRALITDVKLEANKLPLGSFKNDFREIGLKPHIKFFVMVWKGWLLGWCKKKTQRLGWIRFTSELAALHVQSSPRAQDSGVQASLDGQCLFQFMPVFPSPPPLLCRTCSFSESLIPFNMKEPFAALLLCTPRSGFTKKQQLKQQLK